MKFKVGDIVKLQDLKEIKQNMMDINRIDQFSETYLKKIGDRKLEIYKTVQSEFFSYRCKIVGTVIDKTLSDYEIMLATPILNIRSIYGDI